jgi:hypothetical protein
MSDFLLITLLEDLIRLTSRSRALSWNHTRSDRLGEVVLDVRNQRVLVAIIILVVCVSVRFRPDTEGAHHHRT